MDQETRSTCGGVPQALILIGVQVSDLFAIRDQSVSQLEVQRFSNKFTERDLQVWADANPVLLNNGAPMLSLGIEIFTGHGQAIDNLFLDGNGCIVAAELKRGKAPREITAQIVNYAAHISKLEWSDLDQLCQKRHGSDLNAAFSGLFGFKLDTTQDPDHRLLLVAETFEPLVIDDAVYLIDRGTPLALLDFRMLPLGQETLLQTSIALGEIPEQPIAKAALSNRPLTRSKKDLEGRIEWLLSTYENRLRLLDEELAADLEIRRGRTTVSFAPRSWSLPFGDCQFRLTAYEQTVGIYFVFKTSEHPRLEDLLAKQLENSNSEFTRERLVQYSTYTSLSAVFLIPNSGDSGAIDELESATRVLMELVLPLSSGT